MENLQYQYIVHLKKQTNLDEDWEFIEGPTTCQMEMESEIISCDVCRRNFRSKKALWGHKRCCKAARAGTRNEGTSVSGFRHDVLESGWSVTAKRGRKPVLDITGPEFVAAGILIYMSSGKNGGAVSRPDREKRKAEMIESSPFNVSPIAQIVCDDDKFMCLICGKVFPSYQALGGHKASHSKDDTIVNSGKDEKGLMTSAEHRCEVCGMSYPSGQALGGHKRKHWTGSSFLPGNRSKASEIEAVACMHWESLWTDN